MRASVLSRKAAPVSGEFGTKLFVKYFPELDVAEYADCWISWLKVARGGWLVTGPGYYGEGTQGHVVRPGLADVQVERKRKVLVVSTVAQRTAKLETEGEVDQLDPAVRFAIGQGPEAAYALARSRAHVYVEMDRTAARLVDGELR